MEVKMKVVFVLCIIFITTFISCEREVTISNKTASQDASSISTETQPGLTIEVETETPDRYGHFQTLLFEYSGYNTKILKIPLEDDILYTVQAGDKIEVLSVLDFKSAQKTYIEVRTPLGGIGYIEISYNPYKNEEYSFLDSIDVEGVAIKLLKLTESFEIIAGTIVRALPENTAEGLIEIPQDARFEYVQAQAITSDYQWVKIVYKDIAGWVHANSLTAERGGPVICYPEEMINFDLIGGNQI